MATLKNLIVSDTGNFTLPNSTEANRPGSPTTGTIRGNSDKGYVEYYTGGRWPTVGGSKDGSTAARAAMSARDLWELGVRGKGLKYITTPNGGTKQVYCDLDTLDEFGESGWMLVASWSTGSTWTNNYASSSAVFGSTASNGWSSNFGDSRIHMFRVTAAASITGTLPPAAGSGGDWYYYWREPIAWKSVWAFEAGSNKNYMNDTSGAGRGNINAHWGWPAPVSNGVSGTVASIPRVCMRGMNWAYNLTHSYRASSQRWNNFSDSGGGGQQTWYDFWNGLTTSGVTLGVTNLGSDGTLAILPSGATTAQATTCAHDCNDNNMKVGIDDGGVCYYYGSTATANLSANVGNTGTDYPVWFWIK